ncbi:DUF3307 domain-containing protein [Actinomadura chokoriensis]|uniref:DUF3307 domain-containing protein n=1 Tax=Actinomadura chokoriensis TaxID=454156 RepID=A0ABV4R969_9ACTN
MGDPVVFTVMFVALYAAHAVADHWVQTHHQACGKGAATWRGRLLCARHVASLTFTQTVAVAAAVWVTGVSVSPAAAAAGLAVNAVSHYWADRWSTLAWLARILGKGEFHRLGDGGSAPTGTGAYALDQSWHVGWLFVAALIGCIGGAA